MVSAVTACFSPSRRRWGRLVSVGKGHHEGVAWEAGDPPLCVRVRDHPSTVAVRVDGVLDFATAPLLRAVLSELLDDGRPVVVDLAGVTLLDAASVGVLVAARQRADRRQVGLCLHGARGRALRVLEITGVAKLLDPHPADAVEETGEDRTVEWLLGARLRMVGDDASAKALRQMAVRHALGFAASLARRYRGRGEPADDLTQVALVGLLKAVDGYDPRRGTSFHAYAVPTIVGELRRHFRDKGWQLRVPRRLQEIRLEIPRVADVLCQRLGRTPTVGEIATHLSASDEQVVEAMDAGHLYRAGSLSVQTNDDGTGELIDQIGAADEGFDLVEYRESLRPLIAALPVRQQRIVALRFYGNLTQSQIAEAVGLSQMHVSRLLADALSRLREGLLVD